jgi:hypothetical protein
LIWLGFGWMVWSNIGSTIILTSQHQNLLLFLCMGNRLRHNCQKSMFSRTATWHMSWLPTSKLLPLPFTFIFPFHQKSSAVKVPSLDNTLLHKVDSLESNVKLNINKNHYHNPETYSIMYTYHITKYYGQGGSTPALYSGGTGNKSLPRDSLPWQVFVVFLSPRTC